MSFSCITVMEIQEVSASFKIAISYRNLMKSYKVMEISIVDIFFLVMFCSKIFHQLEIALWECNLYKTGQEVWDPWYFSLSDVLCVLSWLFFTVPHRMENSPRTLTAGSLVPWVSPRQSLASPSPQSTCFSRTASWRNGAVERHPPCTSLPHREISPHKTPPSK